MRGHRIPRARRSLLSFEAAILKGSTVSEQDPLSRPIQLGFAAGLVESPEVTYGPELTSVRFPLEEGGFGRVTFEGLDSIRVSRGEHLPYPESDDGGGPPWSWVYVVDGSPWLAERQEVAARRRKKGTSD